VGPSSSGILAQVKYCGFFLYQCGWRPLQLATLETSRGLGPSF
jgi:hypothetical protein